MAEEPDAALIADVGLYQPAIIDCVPSASTRYYRYGACQERLLRRAGMALPIVALVVTHHLWPPIMLRNHLRSG